MATFDPYRKWLGIPEESRPPTHYQLLGISPQESDAEVIGAAVVRQSAYVRNFQSGKYGDDAARILNEIAAAKACLTDTAKRAAYDAELKKKQPPPARQPAASPATARPAPARPAAQPAHRPMQPQAPVAAAPRFDPMLEQAALGSAYAPLHPAFLQPKRRSLAPWQLAVAGGMAIALVVIVGVVVGMLMSGDPAEVADVAPAVNPGPPLVGTSGASGGANGVSGNDNGGAPSVVGGTPPRTNSSGASPVTSNNTAGAGNSGVPSTGTSDDDPPSTSTPRPRRTPPSSTFDWGANQRLSVAAPASHIPIFSRGYTPFVAVGGEVWNLETGASVGKVKKQTERLELAALSPNGRYFARMQGDDYNSNTVEIWDTQEDRRIHDLKFDRTSTRPICMEFTDDEHIIIAWTDSGDAQIQLWNVVEGEGEVWFTTDSFDADDFDVSPDGKYVAVATFSDGVLVYDVKKKKSVAHLVPPGNDFGSRILNCDGLRFAPDGQEIALVEDRGRRILVWNGKAELVYERRSETDFRALYSGSGYDGSAVEWLPNGAGWLLNGHYIFDRESERVVLIVKSDHDGEARAKFLGEGQLIVTRGDRRTRELISVDVPWQKIRNSLAAEDSLSGRNAPVGLDFQLSDLKASTPQTATTELTRIVTDRLREAGTRVGASEAGVLLASYAESTENRQVLQLDGMGRPIFGPGGQPSLINTSVTVGRLDLVFTPAGSSDPLWEINVVADNGGVAGTGNLFSNLAASLNGALLPSFIPASEETLPLPIIADLQ